jgi:hypothetical protein
MVKYIYFLIYSRDILITMAVNKSLIILFQIFCNKKRKLTSGISEFKSYLHIK